LECDNKGKLKCLYKINFGTGITFLDIFHNIGLIGFENGTVSVVECDRFNVLTTVSARQDGDKRRLSQSVKYAGLLMLMSEEAYTTDIEKGTENRYEEEAEALFEKALKDMESFKRLMMRMKIIVSLGDYHFSIISLSSVISNDQGNKSENEAFQII